MNRSGGFTLVELMVALVIGLLVVAGATQVFIMSKRTFDEMSALAERQEALRFMVDVISLDVRTSSGFSVPDEDDEDYDPSDPDLSLSFSSGARQDDPYCSGGELGAVSYEFVGSDGELKVGYLCNGGTWVEGQVVQGGLESVQFSTDAAPFLHVTIVFPELKINEPEDKRTFSFRVLNRESILHKLKFDPGQNGS